MRKLILFAGFFLTLTSSLLAERRGDQGIGLMVGNPSGFTYKFWLDEAFALDAAAGVDQGEFDIHATLLWHNFDWSRNSQDKLLKDIVASGDFPFYVGVGPRTLFDEDSEFGIRFPVGLAFLPHKSEWEFFGELAPVLRLTPDTGGDFDFAVGLRYYFPAIRSRAQ